MVPSLMINTDVFLFLGLGDIAFRFSPLLRTLVKRAFFLHEAVNKASGQRRSCNNSGSYWSLCYVLAQTGPECKQECSGECVERVFIKGITQKGPPGPQGKLSSCPTGCTGSSSTEPMREDSQASVWHGDLGRARSVTKV